MADEFDDFLGGLSRYANFLSGDIEHPLEILVLRGHLLIEEELRRLVLKKCSKPEVFRLHDRTSFKGLLVLCEALYGTALPDWTWTTLRELNRVRNSLAHQLEDKGVQAGVAGIMRAFEARDPTYKYMEGGLLQQFNYCLSAIHTELLKARTS
jgi:hypothetical protein